MGEWQAFFNRSKLTTFPSQSNYINVNFIRRGIECNFLQIY